MAHLLWMIPLVLFYIFIYLLIFSVPVALTYILASIPFYVMARKCGFKHSWVTFLPMGKNYIAFTLPFNEYNIGFFKTKQIAL